MTIIYRPLRGLIAPSGQSNLETECMWHKFNNYIFDRESWTRTTDKQKSHCREIRMHKQLADCADRKII